MGNPTFLYKEENGEVIAKIFDSDDLPKGWVDDPAKVKKGVKDDNSANTNKRRSGSSRGKK